MFLSINFLNMCSLNIFPEKILKYILPFLITTSKSNRVSLPNVSARFFILISFNVLYVFIKPLFPSIDKSNFLLIFVSITANIPLNSFFIFLYRPYPIISIELI